MGVLGAGGAALILDGSDDDRPLRHHREDQLQETKYALSDFDSVSITGPQDVAIVYGELLAVSASGPADALRQFEAVVEDGALVIRPREGEAGDAWDDLDEVTFTVTMPAISRVALTGSGEVGVDRVAGGSFDALVGGSGNLVIGSIEADAATFTVEGSGDLDASGTVRQATVSISGSGEVHATGLTAAAAEVNVGGSGEAELTALEQATVLLSGSGDVDIFGPAACSVTRSGSGDVRCEGGGGDED
ncbi:MAG: head GIN domain-containing protein [Alteraurantiacibacter sp.]